MQINNIASQIPHSSKKWATRNLSDIKIIAVHHEAGIVRADSYNEIEAIKQMASYHIQKNWGTAASPAHAPTTPYHFAIARSGAIYQLNDLSSTTWHANNANGISLGILLQGNLEKQKPSSDQILSLNNLLKFLISGGLGAIRATYSDVYGHGELNGRILSLKYGKLVDFGNYTACPASALPYVQEYRATGSIRNFPRPAEKKPDQVGEFGDLKDGEWYTPFAKAMIETGIMRGYDDKTWRPAEAMTRAEVAKVVIGSLLKSEELLKIYKEQKS